jgi:hypothetical protein
MRTLVPVVVVLLVCLGGCRKQVVEAPTIKVEKNTPPRAVAARTGNSLDAMRAESLPEESGGGLEALRKQSLPEGNDEPAQPAGPKPSFVVIPPPVVVTPNRPVAPPPNTPPQAAPQPPNPPRQQTVRLSKDEVEKRLKQALQPVFIDVSLTEKASGLYVGYVKDTAYTNMPITVTTDYTGTIRYELGVPGAMGRGTITADARHSNTMHIDP